LPSSARAATGNFLQNLPTDSANEPRIKAFFGTSENAVKSQIWIAVSVYVLVAIIRKRLNLSLSLYEMLQILSLTLFEKIELNTVFSRPSAGPKIDPSANQLILFE
jgi:hypothetical protein